MIAKLRGKKVVQLTDSLIAQLVLRVSVVFYHKKMFKEIKILQFFHYICPQVLDCHYSECAQMS
jgi:hypothetical protein